MFPRMKQRLGSALLENLDLLVEFSTLGEYRLDDDARPFAAGDVTDGLEAARPVPAGPTPLPSRSHEPAAPDRSAPAPGSLTTPGRVAAATAAGRRGRRGQTEEQPALTAHATRRRSTPRSSPAPSRRKRAGAPAPPEQLCLSGCGA